MTVVSHRHRFIFLKTEKTAGTSIEIALSKFCGPDDIIARISLEDEKTRRELGYPGPQNDGVAPLTSYRSHDWKDLIKRGIRKAVFYNHMPAAEVRRHVGNAVWDSSFKFCFERNPWDRVLSMYYWQNRKEPRPPLDEYLPRGIRSLRRNGFEQYTIDGKVAVDRICRFEDLDGELEIVRARLGLPEPLSLPRAKGGHRADRRHYRDVLTESQRQRIAEAFKDEIALLGYKY